MVTQSFFSLQDFYGGSIGARLAVAHGLYPDFARELALNEPFTRMLAQALILQKELARIMAALDHGTLCAVCGGRVGGGCCSSFMAGENDVPLLLLNLLAGVGVAALREDAECCFLGKTGCLLLFKPMFCLNYNCKEIRQGAAPAQMQRLEQAVGRLLQQQYALEQLLLDVLRQGGRLIG
ncbi:MAG: hypothetical protein OEV89_06490 [Desulfobulbaceae bacterium]|nr:hypothetical protein [Desulfobulbaceae bacterium]HIJ90398.1 hypothetical protein [Deltaproteobacteria bacterium]